ncbi:rod shape-determining protein MreC [Maribellus maritimus]|uniref:rod shape-determining protein MreC n=1 Tax=Maribellus maritimus TaxID=2870838 RepID=UPI001EEAA836|nr:rod shape-determining protein MreC [Maribellus maritimus]MCG6186143.1 rod shape-determining protein MreC [Maribellus maritimus]
MRSLFRYLFRNYGFFLFIILEIVALFLVFNYNNYQKVKYLNSSNVVAGSVYNSFNSVVSYFALARVNAELAAENAKLRSRFQTDESEPMIFENKAPAFVPSDSTLFQFISAKVINNSVNKPFNYITLNKGRSDGVKPDQGIISASGIVGVVTNVLESYSMGLSVLNQRWSVSSKLKKNGSLGSLLWDGEDYRFAELMEIPFHVELQLGDTIVTSGYSSIFPEGVIIGTVNAFDKPAGENYYNITVKLTTNFKALSYVEVVENLHVDEIKELEKLIQENERGN